MLEAARHGESPVVAPTGGGKTLAGFLPGLTTRLILRSRSQKINAYTLYISPLKALVADIERNLMMPITEMVLPFRAETRTGDTSAADRQRQRHQPPDILMTTPELPAMLAWDDADPMLQKLDTVILAEFIL